MCPCPDSSRSGRLKRDADGLVGPPSSSSTTPVRCSCSPGWTTEALHRTLTTGRATYWSRSRKELAGKGAASGHRQWVREVRLDCDGDAVLVSVDQDGPACHTEPAPTSTQARSRPPSGRGHDQSTSRPGSMRLRVLAGPAGGPGGAASVRRRRDPRGCVSEARGQPARDVHFLEVAEHGGVWSRYSFIGAQS